MKYKLVVMLFLVLSAAMQQSAFAGRIVLSSDEWALSNTGFQQSPDAETFALNIASWFTGGESGKFLVYSKNFSLTQSLLKDTMITAGNTWEINYQTSFTLNTIMDYDGIFLAGDPADTSVLIDYVSNGGNVFLAGGTGGLTEASLWNPFLTHFGLQIEPRYNALTKVNTPISSDHPVFTGVSKLYQYNGSDISLTGTNDFSRIIGTYNDDALYAVFEPHAFDQASSSVPIPTTIWLFGSGLIGFLGIARKKII